MGRAVLVPCFSSCGQAGRLPRTQAVPRGHGGAGFAGRGGGGRARAAGPTSPALPPRVRPARSSFVCCLLSLALPDALTPSAQLASSLHICVPGWAPWFPGAWMLLGGSTSQSRPLVGGSVLLDFSLTTLRPWLEFRRAWYPDEGLMWPSPLFPVTLLLSIAGDPPRPRRFLLPLSVPYSWLSIHSDTNLPLTTTPSSHFSRRWLNPGASISTIQCASE